MLNGAVPHRRLHSSLALISEEKCCQLILPAFRNTINRGNCLCKRSLPPEELLPYPYTPCPYRLNRHFGDGITLDTHTADAFWCLDPLL